MAPSPTGSPHVGLARTALYNWAFARHHGGTFVFRIEDTDKERNTQESYDALFEVMGWLGLDWDEGPDVGGPFAPYRQSERGDIYADVLARLYEGELAVVIGRICRDVPAEKAADVIWGYTVGNDVTARDLQRSDVQFTRAKGFDSFCPLGPWVETELDVSDLRVRTFLNGDQKQDGSTKDMIFDVPALVAHVSSVMTLLPGDVILTGTPEGVGPMQVGDEVEISISGIGNLTNQVKQRD
jgi:hypothetical protein